MITTLESGASDETKVVVAQRDVVPLAIPWTVQEARTTLERLRAPDVQLDGFFLPGEYARDLDELEQELSMRSEGQQNGKIVELTREQRMRFQDFCFMTSNVVGQQEPRPDDM